MSSPRFLQNLEHRLCRGALAWTVVMVTALGATQVDAQYFGRNKVQYEDFEFRVLETEHFDVYYYPREAEAARMASRMAERWYTRLSRIFDYQMRTRQPLILYASHPHFRQTNAVSGGIGEGTGGVTESFKRRIVLPLTSSLEATDHVIGHELVHAFQFAMTGADAGQASLAGMPSALGLPLWFIEGMAEYLSLGPIDPHTAMWLREALARDDLPTIDELDDPEYFPYRYGHAFWAYVAGRWGDDAVRTLLLAAADPRIRTDAIPEVLGITTETLSADWHAAINRQYGQVLAATTAAERLVTPQFINSSGIWHPDGRQFAFGAIHAGQPVLTIVNTQSGNTDREIELPDLGEIFNPTWSPDGGRIAFSALTGDVSDLYVYDLSASRLQRLTDDAYSDLEPAWSPDGKAIAFATDRFTTNLDTLAIGELRLALIDPASSAIRALPGFDGAKHISPQWSPDGQRLYFVGNPNGIPNLFRLEIGNGRLDPLTHLQTGISGITAASPALSVAATSGRVAFTLYGNDEYRIYVADSPEAVVSGAPVQLASGLNAAVLPPARRAAGPLQALLSNPSVGLPAASADFPVTDYEPSLSLDYLGQPTIGFGADSFGTYVGGSLSAFFSDMLGNHQVGASVQTGGGLRDIGGQLQYVNRSSRWIWGGAVSRNRSLPSTDVKCSWKRR